MYTNRACLFHAYKNKGERVTAAQGDSLHEAFYRKYNMHVQTVCTRPLLGKGGWGGRGLGTRLTLWKIV